MEKRAQQQAPRDAAQSARLSQGAVRRQTHAYGWLRAASLFSTGKSLDIQSPADWLLLGARIGNQAVGQWLAERQPVVSRPVYDWSAQCPLEPFAVHTRAPALGRAPAGLAEEPATEPFPVASLRSDPAGWPLPEAGGVDG